MSFKGATGTIKIIDKATAPIRAITKAFAGLGKSTQKTNTQLTKTQKAINGVSKAQSRLGRLQASNKRATKDIGSQAVGIAALAISFKAALGPAMKFEQSMKDLQAVAFGSADATVPVAKNMALLSEQAKKLGATTAHSATQAAEAQIFLAKAGFKTNQILSAMPALLDLSSASGTELGRTSDVLSDLLGAFGMQAKDSGRLADVLAAATSSANVDIESLFETLKVAAPIGIAAGQSMEGITTATALLGNVGIKGSMAGTALKNSFVNLASPASKGAKVLEELGINVQDSAGNMLPMQDIMMNLGKEAKKLSQVKRIEAFSAVFGKIAMAGAINLEKAVTSGDFDKMLTNLQNSEGVAKKMAKIRMDSTEGSITQLMSAVEGIAIAFGTILTPILRTVAEALTGITPIIQTFIKENKDLIEIIGLVAGALLAGKVVMLAYTATLWLIGPALTALSVALKIVKVGMIAFNLVVSGNPISLIILAIAAFAAAGIALYKNWEPVKKFFADLWETIKGLAKSLTSLPDMSNITGSISEGASSMWEGTKSFFGGGSSNQTTPAQATQSIQQNTVNTPVQVVLNAEGVKVNSVQTKGASTVDTFLDSGVQN